MQEKPENKETENANSPLHRISKNPSLEPSPLVKHLKEKWDNLQLFKDEQNNNPEHSPTFTTTRSPRDTPKTKDEPIQSAKKSGFSTVRHIINANPTKCSSEEKLLDAYGNMLHYINVRISNI